MTLDKKDPSSTFIEGDLSFLNLLDRTTFSADRSYSHSSRLQQHYQPI